MTTAETGTRIASIVLCAGRGHRMGAVRTPKVCFPVAGKAAIVHMLERLTALECAPNILVIGHLGGTVVEEVGPRFPHVLFAYQAELLGTGHATKQGASVLSQVGFNGAVLVIAGDKFVEPRTLKKLIHVFESESADLALVVSPKRRWPRAGRIVTGGDGHVLSIIEHADLQSAKADGRGFDVGGKQFTAYEIEDTAEWVNQAVYLYRADALFEALGHLGRDNVQREEYLTDTVGFLIEGGKRVVPVPVDDSEDVLGFNDPSELLDIEEHFRKTRGIEPGEEHAPDPRLFKPPEAWARRLGKPDQEVSGMLRAIYGDNQAFCEEKRSRLLEAVELFIGRYGTDGVVSVVRSPGRINLMGRHVDHRGGNVNLMAIDREHILVARRRTDTTVRARNSDAHTFDDLEFNVDELLRQVRLDDWREFVDSEAVVEMVRDLRGNWGNYLKAPMLRLQQQFKDRYIHGVDCVVSGDIPMAAGLSSSSALVVAMAEALALTNHLDVSPHELVDLCGEGEWFVGTRGGSADHAAVRLSHLGQVANAGFFPFSIRDYAPFPPGHALVICHSQVQARKAEGARNAFNERVASYEMAVHLVRKRFPNYAPLIHHLRDVSPDGLGVRSVDVYRILLDVPEAVTPSALRAELGDETFERLTLMHEPPEAYSLRRRLLFGIAECERSKQFFRLLLDGDMEKAGWLMNVSHDGDRVVGQDGRPFEASGNEDYIRARIDDLQSEDPERVLAGQLYAQPGSYACSIPAIDCMVDIALATPGVLGAQLAGAGLGGCMMALVRQEAASALIERMGERYYAPNDLEPSALPVTPIAGCSALALGD
jgi:N-acetylgalactosamine kinase